MGIKHQFDDFDISDLVRQSSNVMVTDIFYGAFCREVNESRVPGSRQNNVQSELLDCSGDERMMLSIAAEVFQQFLADVDVPIIAEPFDVNITSNCPGAYVPLKKIVDHWRKIMTTFK
tara:strand:+ start:190 stop:543 length:354 start_codon:yes stop_codon:yes gene_type:complete